MVSTARVNADHVRYQDLINRLWENFYVWDDNLVSVIIVLISLVCCFSVALVSINRDEGSYDLTHVYDGVTQLH